MGTPANFTEIFAFFPLDPLRDCTEFLAFFLSVPYQMLQKSLHFSCGSPNRFYRNPYIFLFNPQTKFTQNFFPWVPWQTLSRVSSSPGMNKPPSQCLSNSFMTVWPSGLRRWLQAPVRKGVGSNPTAVTSSREGLSVSRWFGHAARPTPSSDWLYIVTIVGQTLC